MVIAFQTEEPGGEVAKLEAEAGSTFISLPHVLAMHDLRRAAVGGSSFFLRQEGSEMHESPARLDDCYEFSLSNRGTHTLGPGSVIPQVPGVVDTLKRSCRPEIVGAVVERIPILVVDNRWDGLEVDFPADSENHPVGEHFTATDNNHDSLLARFDRARDPTFMHGVDPNGGGLVPEMMGRPLLPKEAAGLHVQMETLHEERESYVGVSHSVSDFSHFTSLGDAAQAVVLRLQSKIPRLRVYGVRSVLNEGGSEDGSR